MNTLEGFPKTSVSSEFHLEAAEIALTVAQLLASNSLPAAPPTLLPLLLLLFGVDWLIGLQFLLSAVKDCLTCLSMKYAHFQELILNTRANTKN